MAQNQGSAPTSAGERYGLMDAEGKRITEALYSDIEALSDDLYLCSIEDGLYRITLNYNR